MLPDESGFVVPSCNTCPTDAARLSAPHLAPVAKFIVLVGPASTWRLIPIEPLRLMYGAFANASTTVFTAASLGAWLCVLSAIQSTCTKMSGLPTVAPMAGRLTNCGPEPSPGSTVVPLIFQSSGMPSPVLEASANTQ